MQKNGEKGRTLTMKIPEKALTELDQRGLLTVQSNFTSIAYAVDRFNREIYVIDRTTGAQLEISHENLYAFAHELMDIADLHLSRNKLFRVG